MIQRLQTLFFIGVIVSQATLFFINLGSINSFEASYNFSLSGFQRLESAGELALPGSNSIWGVVLNSVICVFTAYIIFQFKNRNLQTKLAGFNMVLLCGFIALVFFQFEDMRTVVFERHSEQADKLSVMYGLGMILPLLSLIMNGLAIRGIRKDEALVRSADRIR
jgi:hypothetical protein